MILKPAKLRLPIKGHWGTKGLVGLWLFNDSPPLLGKTYDLSGNRNTGTLVGDTHIVAGKFGPALSFDGTEDGVTSSTTPLQYGYTICGWFKFSSVTSTQTLFDLTFNVAWPALFIQNSLVYLYLSSGVELHSAAILVPNVWTHLCLYVANTSNNCSIYINGQLSYGGLSAGTGNAISGFTIAKASGGAGELPSLNGLIDNVMIFNRALSAAEVAQLYREPFGMFDRERIELWSQGGAPPVGLSIPVAMATYRRRRVA